MYESKASVYPIIMSKTFFLNKIIMDLIYQLIIVTYGYPILFLILIYFIYLEKLICAILLQNLILLILLTLIYKKVSFYFLILKILIFKIQS